MSSRALAPRSYAGVLFDLDGTLLDTACDITVALNRALEEQGWDPLPERDVRGMIGRGGYLLVERAAQAQGRALATAERDAVAERFFHHYGLLEEHGEARAQPYPEVVEVIRRLHAAGLSAAVVTNKQHRFAVELLQRLGLSRYFGIIVGGDTCARRKPDPMPMLHACEALGLAACDVIAVGDSVNDVQAARAARIPVVCVTYGYNEGQDPRQLPADAFIDSFRELPGLLELPR